MRNLLLPYLFEASFCLTLFALFFRLFLDRLTFYYWNRLFLVSAGILSMVLPCISISYAKTLSLPTHPIEISSFNQLPVYIAHKQRVESVNAIYPIENLLVYLYLLITLILAIRFALQLFALYKLINSHPVIKETGFNLVKINSRFPSSSFFNYIFLHTDGLEEREITQVIAHEKVHVAQFHSLDMLLMHLLSIVFWFNPISWWLKKKTAINHEYLADTSAHMMGSPVAYARLLVKLASQETPFPLVHNFSKIQLKNRIIMLHQAQSASIKKMRFLLSLPLLAMMLFIVSCEKESDPAQLENQSLLGTWINVDRTTVNNDDGNKPRIFPQRSGGLQALTEELTLNANGTFTMRGKENGHSVSGTWRVTPDRIAMAGNWVNIYPQENAYSGRRLTLTYKASALLPKTIEIQCISITDQKIEAYQSYAKDHGLSGGTIYYQYVKR